MDREAVNIAEVEPGVDRDGFAAMFAAQVLLSRMG